MFKLNSCSQRQVLPHVDDIKNTCFLVSHNCFYHVYWRKFCNKDMRKVQNTLQGCVGSAGRLWEPFLNFIITRNVRIKVWIKHRDGSLKAIANTTSPKNNSSAELMCCEVLKYWDSGKPTLVAVTINIILRAYEIIFSSSCIF